MGIRNVKIKTVIVSFTSPQPPKHGVWRALAVIRAIPQRRLTAALYFFWVTNTIWKK